MPLNTKSEAGVSQKQPLQPPTIHVIFLFICTLAPGGSTQSRTRFIPMTSSIAPFQSSVPLSPDADKRRKTNACFDIEQGSDAESSMAPLGADYLLQEGILPIGCFLPPFPPSSSRYSNAHRPCTPASLCGQNRAFHIADLNLPHLEFAFTRYTASAWHCHTENI